MKNMITVLSSLFALVLLLTACSNNLQPTDTSTTPTKPIPPAVQNHVEGVFSSEHTPEQFLETLANEKIELVRSKEPDGRFVEYGDFYGYRTTSNEVNASFTSDNQFVRLCVQTPRYATERGLRVGDSEEKLFELYGDNLQRGEYNPSWLYRIEGDIGIGFSLDFVDGNWSVGSWTIFEPTLFAERTEAALSWEE